MPLNKWGPSVCQRERSTQGQPRGQSSGGASEDRKEGLWEGVGSSEREGVTSGVWGLGGACDLQGSRGDVHKN